MTLIIFYLLKMIIYHIINQMNTNYLQYMNHRNTVFL